MSVAASVVRDARAEDVAAIDSLRKQEGDALGFIPLGAYQSVALRAPVDGRWRHLHSRLVVLLDNDDITGFCYASYAGHTAKIFQIVVRTDARRWHRAMQFPLRQRKPFARPSAQPRRLRIGVSGVSRFRYVP